MSNIPWYYCWICNIYIFVRAIIFLYFPSPLHLLCLPEGEECIAKSQHNIIISYKNNIQNIKHVRQAPSTPITRATSQLLYQIDMLDTSLEKLNSCNDKAGVECRKGNDWSDLISRNFYLGDIVGMNTVDGVAYVLRGGDDDGEG